METFLTIVLVTTVPTVIGTGVVKIINFYQKLGLIDPALNFGMSGVGKDLQLDARIWGFILCFIAYTWAEVSYGKKHDGRWMIKDFFGLK